MPIKFRRLHETATLDAGATIPKHFNYKSAFFIFIICAVGLALLVYGAAYLFTMNRISTTYAEAVASSEQEVRAQAPAVITKVDVLYGKFVKQGEPLFEVELLKDSTDQATINRYKAAAQVERNRLKLLESGADIGIAKPIEVLYRYADALRVKKAAAAEVAAEEAVVASVKDQAAAANSGKQRELQEVILRRNQAQAAYKTAQEDFKKADDYYKENIITVDKYDFARKELERRKLDVEAADKVVALVTQAVDDMKRQGDASIRAEEGVLAKVKASQAQADEAFASAKDECMALYGEAPENHEEITKLIIEQTKQGRGQMLETQQAIVANAMAQLNEVLRSKGIVLTQQQLDGLINDTKNAGPIRYTYYAPMNGKVGWIQARVGDTVVANDFVMKLFSAEGMEVQARLAEDTAARVAPGDDVDVKLRTGKGTTLIKGKVVAITNQFYTLPQQDRERVRIEHPGVEMNLVIVRISLTGPGKEDLFPGDPVTVTIHTSTK